MWLRRFLTGISYVQQLADEYNSLEELRESLGTHFTHGFNADEKDSLSLQDYVKFNPLHNPDYFYGYVWFRQRYKD